MCLTVLGISGCGIFPVEDPEPVLEVTQNEGGETHWILPGKRKLSPRVFGFPGNPKFTYENKMRYAIHSNRYSDSIVRLLKQYPYLIGVPMKKRMIGTRENWILHRGTPFSNDVRDISDQNNFLKVRYVDRTWYDRGRKPFQSDDEAQLHCRFYDPSGTKYSLDLRRVIQPPFPGYQTEGGVMIDSWHHGDTGTGSPLMPEVYTYGAFWGIADLYIDEQLAQANRLVHVMTTEVVRDRYYRLALDEEMPLSRENRFRRDQNHQTSITVYPVQWTRPPLRQLRYRPLLTAYRYRNERYQPFISVSFDEAKIRKGQKLLGDRPDYLGP